MRRTLALAVLAVLAACGPSISTPKNEGISTVPLAPASAPNVLAHAAIGFSVDTPQRAATAASQGVTATFLYSGLPPRSSALYAALTAHHIAMIDASISGYLDEWECYRILTIKPPPKGYRWCYPGETGIKTVAQLLQKIKPVLERDARLGAAGFWILDDWPYWDSGSAHDVLPQIRSEIAEIDPGKPTIGGFAGTVGKLKGPVGWYPGTGKNYSNAGCDAVGWYNYSPFGKTRPSNGDDLDWSMSRLLPAIANTLEHLGWNEKTHPLIGIGQAWSGSYSGKYYQPGLSAEQMRTQAEGFCGFGASSISWYAWDDSGFESRTQTPNSSPVISAGIAEGIAACRQVWGSPK